MGMRMQHAKRQILVIAGLALAACAGMREPHEPAPELEARAPAADPADGSPVVLRPGSTHYFALATPAATGEGVSNFQFVRFAVGRDRRVSGVLISQPYGTGGMAGSFRGVYDPEAGVVRAQLEYLAEGDRYGEARDFALTAAGLAMGYEDAEGQPVVIPRRDENGYRAIHHDFHQQMLEGTLNTTDRSRLVRVKALRELFSREKLEAVRFYERYADLDHDPRTTEYLLYVMDPMLCGSGGCSLFVIDDRGTVVSSSTVVKLPVYTTRTSLAEEQERAGQWRHLYVWSQGMRRLEASGGRYPGNASVQPRILEAQLADLPEHYRLLMDHLEP